MRRALPKQMPREGLEIDRDSRLLRNPIQYGPCMITFLFHLMLHNLWSSVSLRLHWIKYYWFWSDSIQVNIRGIASACAVRTTELCIFFSKLILSSQSWNSVTRSTALEILNLPFTEVSLKIFVLFFLLAIIPWWGEAKINHEPNFWTNHVNVLFNIRPIHVTWHVWALDGSQSK